MPATETLEKAEPAPAARMAPDVYVRLLGTAPRPAGPAFHRAPVPRPAAMPGMPAPLAPDLNLIPPAARASGLGLPGARRPGTAAALG